MASKEDAFGTIYPSSRYVKKATGHHGGLRKLFIQVEKYPRHLFLVSVGLLNKATREALFEMNRLIVTHIYVQLLHTSSN